MTSSTGPYLTVRGDHITTSRHCC